jgi:hypothetical protein
MAIGVRCLDEFGKQRAALVVHHRDGMIVLVVQGGVDDGKRDRAVLRFDAVDAGHEFARLLGCARAVRHRFLQLAKPRLHIFVGLRDGRLFDFDVAGFGHEHEVARGNRAPIHCGANLLGQFRAGADAAHVVRKPFVRATERVQGKPRNQQHKAGQQAEG